MEWYVLCYDFNRKKLTSFNIFNNICFNEGIEYIINNYRFSVENFFEDFKEAIRIKLMSAFWCRREYELSIGDAFDEDLDNYKKVDVYSQVLPNLDRLCEYILNYYLDN